MKTTWTFIGLFLAVTIALVNGMCWPEHVQSQFCKADYVIRVKITSFVKIDVPELPPTPKLQKPGNRGKGHANGHNKIKKNIIDKLGPVPLRHMEPEPRIRRSLTAPAGIGGGFPGREWFRFPRYQDIKIKRILKGVGSVEQTVGATPEDKNTTKKYTRYYGRVYIRDPFGVKQGKPGKAYMFKPGKVYLLAGRIINNKLWVSRCDWNIEWKALNIDQIRSLKKDFIHGCKCRVKTCFSTRQCEKLAKEVDVCTWRPDSYIPTTDCKVQHSSCRKANGRCNWKHSPRFVKCKKVKEGESP